MPVIANGYVYQSGIIKYELFFEVEECGVLYTYVVKRDAGRATPAEESVS